MFHGLPKMTGFKTWNNLGTTFMYPLGIKFLPTLWGFLGAITEFGGGILLALGLATRISATALIIMMFVAVSWHLKKRDSFIIYSFPLTLIFVYMTFLLIGGGTFSFDNYLAQS
jgi:putative oxidoreductase